MCAAMFLKDDMVVLTAQPGAGSVFDGWQGSGCTGIGTCTVTMDGDKTVTASFSKPAAATDVRLNVDATAAYREEDGA